MQRETLIAQLVAGKRVLDVGSVGQSDQYCLWKLLADHAGDLIGVDLPEASEVAKDRLGVTDKGLAHKDDTRIVFGNMEEILLDRRFDVVTAGDVIEHISNPGLFLDNVRRHLEPGGLLVITTPNAKWPTVFLKPNATHVLWHDRYTLTQLVARHGFVVESMQYYVGNKPDYAWWKRLLLIRQQLLLVARSVR